MLQEQLKKLSTFPYVLLGAGMAVLGFMSASYIINSFWPFDVQRLDLVRATVRDEASAAMLLDAANFEIILAFLAMVALSITGLCLPLAYYLNKRFSPTHEVSFFIALRQAVWVGVWVAFCVWLQMNRTLGMAVALLVGAVLIMFEILLQVRTRAAVQAAEFGDAT